MDPTELVMTTGRIKAPDANGEYRRMD
jgi:hypothetical protein